jgi:hypothetical protein
VIRALGRTRLASVDPGRFGRIGGRVELLGFGHALVANMTGNAVLLGLAVFQDPGDVLHLAYCRG